MGNSIDWKKFQTNVSRKDDYKLFGTVMGLSGSGKSSCLASMPGRILWLYSEAWESHGPEYALSLHPDAKITAVNIQQSGNTELDLDGQLAYLRAILGDTKNLSANFDSVAIDGLTTLEYIFANSNECKAQAVSKTGAKDAWAVFRLTSDFFNELYIILNSLNKAGVHVMTSCLGSHAADEEGNAIFKPKLAGVGVAEAFLAKLPDRILTVRTKDGKFKFNLKESIQKGSDLRVVDCSPRLFPLHANEVPQDMSPDFTKVLLLKNGKARYNAELGKVEKAV
jgi:hypothetical protein